MKKCTLFLIGLTISISGFSQLNPIKNLDFDHRYVMPTNYFSLTWDIPDIGTDTLKGYNIYRNNELYRFQEDTILNHEQYGESNCDEDFCGFEEVPFYIYVKAVYNSSMTESNYNDSVICGGLYMSIENNHADLVRFYPNPTDGKVFINNGSLENTFYIYDLSGRIIMNMHNVNEVDLGNYDCGIYLFKYFEGDNETTAKIRLTK